MLLSTSHARASKLGDRVRARIEFNKLKRDPRVRPAFDEMKRQNQVSFARIVTAVGTAGATGLTTFAASPHTTDAGLALFFAAISGTYGVAGAVALHDAQLLTRVGTVNYAARNKLLTAKQIDIFRRVDLLW
jgi:hypothetical protein